MLKLINGEALIGTIDGNNKKFKSSKIIGRIHNIYVDGAKIEYLPSKKRNTIELEIAPTESIFMDYFYREAPNIEGSGETSLAELKTSFYKKIGRLGRNGEIPENISRIYPEDYVVDEIRRSYKRITHKSPKKRRLQQYALVTMDSYKVVGESMDNVITFDAELNTPIEGMLMLENGVTYDYYNDGAYKFNVKDVDISKVGDGIVIGHRVIYGAEKVSAIYVDGIEFEYIDERDFNIFSSKKFTIIKNWQGDEYIFLSYWDKVKTVVVKYISEVDYIEADDELVDIPEEFIDVIIYDTAYRLLQEKEDERWIHFKDELGNGRKVGLLYEYQSYVKSTVQDKRATIGIAPTFNNKEYLGLKRSSTRSGWRI